MGNAWRVFLRDAKRLFKSPSALVVAIALIILPSLYTWFNVVGFWNPYENTDGLTVCVVNEDTGVDDETMGHLDVGAQIVAELEDNHQLNWYFTDRETADAMVRGGKAYAAFVIPGNFSYCFTTLLTGDFQQPEIIYYVNEKAGAVSPKITDAGATTLDESINSMFVSIATGVVVDVANDALANAHDTLEAEQAGAVQKFHEAEDAIAGVRTSVDDLRTTIADATGRAQGTKAMLASTKSDIALASDSLDNVAKLTLDVQNSLAQFWAGILPALDASSALASKAIAQANADLAALSSAVSSAQIRVDGALEAAQDVHERIQPVIESLQELLEQTPEDDPNYETLAGIVETLQTRDAEFAETLERLEGSRDDVADGIDALSDLADALSSAAATAHSDASDMRDVFAGTTIPAINTALSQISSTASSLASAVAAQSILVDQAMLSMDALVDTLSAADEALGQTDILLQELQASLGQLRTDFSALQASELFGGLMADHNINAERISEFMRSPVELTTVSLYPLNAYGSAMMPLFMNLTLWIGVFMLLVILKQEVDDEGFEHLSAGQRYLGRLLLLTPMAALQAVVCCVGNLVIGVQVVNVGLYFLTAVIASLAYLNLQYMLACTLQHVGKGFCIFLVFLQIPGATGLYPLELEPEFFQTLSPFFPFTHGINAIRETSAGMYGSQWATYIAALVLFAAMSLLIGLVVRPYLTNTNRLFAKQLMESDIINAEAALMPERRFRLGQVFSALSDHEEFGADLRERTRRFLRWYPTLKKASILLSVLVPAASTALLALAGVEKVVVLTSWLAWFAIIVVFVVVVEHTRDSLERQLALESYSDDELRTIVASRGKVRGVAQEEPAGEAQAATPAESLRPAAAPRGETPAAGAVPDGAASTQPQAAPAPGGQRDLDLPTIEVEP